MGEYTNDMWTGDQNALEVMAVTERLRLLININ